MGPGAPNPAGGLSDATYRELRSIAAAYMADERPGHTLQPTALVHEVLLRVGRDAAGEAADRTRFLAHAARAMRSILIDHARARRAAKRGGARQRVALDPTLVLFEQRAIDLLALDEALQRLAEHDPRAAQVVELRFFGGLEHAEVARLLGAAPRTIEREWRYARAWLFDALAAHTSENRDVE